MSIREQTYSDLEISVVDNFSTDGTAAIASRLADRFFQLGPERSAQRNAGLQNSTGEFIFFVDSDMVVEPHVVERCVNRVATSPCIIAIPEISIGEGYWSRCKAFERSFYVSDKTTAAARFYPRSLLISLGGYDEHLYAGEDWDLSMRASAVMPLDFIDEIIIHDEGRLSWLVQTRKKFYYGLNLPCFIRKHGREARARLSPLRPSLVNNARVIAARPLVGAGMILLKIGEMVAGVLGIIIGTMRLRYDVRHE